MATLKQMHLLNDDDDDDENDMSALVNVGLPDSSDMQELQNVVAAHFAIVEPRGIGFVSRGQQLTTVADVRGAEDPIAIMIDGRGVREVPGPHGLPFFGNYFEIYPDHLGNHQRQFDKYGPLFVTNNMGSRVYHTNDPRLSQIVFAEGPFFSKHIKPGHPLYAVKVKEAGVFLGDTETEQWRLAHKFLPPALGPKAVRHYAPTIQSTVQDAFSVFDELDRRGDMWNVHQYMLKMASQSIGKLILGMDFDHFAGLDTPCHEVVRAVSSVLELNKKISAVGRWYAYMPFGHPRRLRQGIARIRVLILNAIAKASKEGQEDLQLQDAALEAENVIDYFLRAKDHQGTKLPPEQFGPVIVVAMAAGFATTASLLSWLIYSLVKYPGQQQRLLQELIDNDWHQDTQVTDDLTSRLKFLDNFVKETQRRHSSAYQPARTAKRDMILPGGYKLPKDAVVIPSLHHLHLNASVWDNPTRFDPDRWDTASVKNRAPVSFAPFAAGPRMCVGFNFALQEVKVFLTKLVYRFDFSLAHGGAIEYDPYFQLINPDNLYVRAERRVKWPPKSESLCPTHRPVS